MEIIIGRNEHIGELEKLYNSINEYFEDKINYPGWKKGIYPVRKDAEAGIEERNLYIALHEGRIIGSIIINNTPELAYADAEWLTESDYERIYVVHTLVVHPDYLKIGIGKKLLEFGIENCKRLKAISLRLYVYEKNTPAIKLYERLGFEYVDTVDLGLRGFGLNWFKLYEKIL